MTVIPLWIKWGSLKWGRISNRNDKPQECKHMLLNYNYKFHIIINYNDYYMSYSNSIFAWEWVKASECLEVITLKNL